MTDQANCPDEITWRDWLTGSGNVAVDETVLQSHLDDCERCQGMVARLSADDPFLCQSREALRSTGLTSHDWQVGDADGADRPSSETSSPAIVSLVQTLLGPTEDERSLGRLGRFEILGVVGSGGMGIVLKARSVDMDRVVAIKIPQPQYWQSPQTLLTLEREARSAAAVVHPNVISIYHVDRYRDVPYLVMPYLAGQSLEQRIRDSGPMPLDEALRITRQVASALAAAHACGVVHRDVKPANILLNAGTERAVLSDFGLAKVQTDATCTATGTFAGTPIYLSPEQASGCGAGPAGDIYSLGTVLWTMLVGQPPMSGMHTHAIVRRIADSQLPLLSDHCRDLPVWVNRLIAKLHADIPADRPPAEQLTQWIEACQRHLAEGGSAPIPKELSVNEVKSRRTAAIAAICLATVLIAGAGWMMFDAFGGGSETTPHREKTRTVQPRNSGPVKSNASAPQPSKPTTPTESVADAPSNSIADETDTYLDQVEAELDLLNQIALPRLESELQSLLPDSP
ncbi:serine/threonine protein kinase [Planctomycetes bacterium TBK1r]|uniref:Serine/threonine-protein kinase PrkC n=1 Tax=Stieleria magnilauensis TaxID=2527963 RepID=A0ABX5XXG7_9BACT|nr:Serine/threonine-protein kinase PrkC [Planctomycetes bacterium TBK1r]